MKKVIAGKVRDTKKMERIAGRSGNSNDCYSTYSYLLHDSRDGKFFHWTGHHWGGLGPDSLDLVDNPLEFIEEEGYQLSDQDAEKIESVLGVK